MTKLEGRGHDADSAEFVEELQYASSENRNTDDAIAINVHELLSQTRHLISLLNFKEKLNQSKFILVKYSIFKNEFSRTRHEGSKYR